MRINTTPRSSWSRSRPVTLAATRVPGSTRVRDSSCDCSPRTRTGPPGTASSRSSAASEPPVSVPVTTTPAPATRKLRSIHSRGRPRSTLGPAASRAEARAARSSSSPMPAGAATSTIGQEAPTVPARCPSTSERASSTSSGSAMSTRVRATTPWRTSSRSSTARCSSDWGIHPSSPATTRRATSNPPTPASMLRTNRSWPGTSTNPTRCPFTSAQANPRSMVRPRSFSSCQRSGSRPVSARTSVDLP